MIPQILYRYYSDINHIIYHAILLIGIAVALYRLKLINRSSRIALLLLIITMMTELAAYYCAVKFRDNRFIYAPFTLVQFSIITAAFYLETRLKLMLAFLGVFILFVLLNSILMQPFLRSSNSNNFLLAQLLIIILYFMYLADYFKNTGQDSLKYYPLFWLGLGWMLFAVSSIIGFGFDYITPEGSFWDSISVWVKRISNYLLYLSFSIAFLSKQKSLDDIPAGK